jgi:molybdenum cofactor cytidylyltransferase
LNDASSADPMKVGAVLLAAGSASRIGGRPKALLELGGTPLILRQLASLFDAGIDDVVVVLGHHAGQIEPVVRAFPLTRVHNPSPDDGLVSSQRLGLQGLSGRLDAVLMALADQPLVDARDITALIAAYCKRPAGTSVLVPRVAGQPGNPVIFSAAVREQILAGDATLGCRQWRMAHPGAVAAFDTDNRHYRVDIDTPEDIERFERETGRSLRWPIALAPT